MTTSALSEGELSDVLAAIGSGALLGLERLELRCRFSSPPLLPSAPILPNSLPSLRALDVSAIAGDALLAGLLGAAGPDFGTLVLKYGPDSTAAVRLLAGTDYPWLPSLRQVDLAWHGDQRGWNGDGDLPERVVTALSRMPALEELTLMPSLSDGLVVRLLALLDGGGLAHLLRLNIYDQGSEFRVSVGALLLLVMWVKTEAQRKVPGPTGRPVRKIAWYVPLPLTDYKMPESLMLTAKRHIGTA